MSAEYVKDPKKHANYQRFVALVTYQWRGSEDLAEELGVSKRAIWRYAATARQQGLLVHSHNGRGGGYGIEP